VSASAEGHSTPPNGAHTEPEQCPICGAPLRDDQDWCLRCGTAARTRLAPVPRWRALLITLVVVAVLSLAGLTAALVKLTGGSGGGGSAKGAAPLTSAPVVTSAPAVTLATSSTTATTAATTITTTTITVPARAGATGTGATGGIRNGATARSTLAGGGSVSTVTAQTR
jgi:hypothetical protein